jgi:hypothetical protein
VTYGTSGDHAMSDPNREIQFEDALALASEHGGMVALRDVDDDCYVYILKLDRAEGDLAGHGLVAVDVGGTEVVLPEDRFREIVEVSRYIRALLTNVGPREGVEHLAELIELADETGGALAFRRWLGEDDFEPVLFRISRYIGDGFIELEIGRVLLRVGESDFDRLIEERLG